MQKKNQPGCPCGCLCLIAEQAEAFDVSVVISGVASATCPSGDCEGMNTTHILSLDSASYGTSITGGPFGSGTPASDLFWTADPVVACSDFSGASIGFSMGCNNGALVLTCSIGGGLSGSSTHRLSVADGNFDEAGYKDFILNQSLKSLVRINAFNNRCNFSSSAVTVQLV